MNDEFKKYLTSIGIGKPVAERVEAAYQFYKNILEMVDDEVKDIFITDYIKKDNSREYENLWFFSEKYVMEAKLFINMDDFDFMPSRGLKYLRIDKQNYDFKQATDQSRMSVEYGGQDMLSGELRASKENCDRLRYITIKYLMPIIK